MRILKELNPILKSLDVSIIATAYLKVIFLFFLNKMEKQNFMIMMEIYGLKENYKMDKFHSHPRKNVDVKLPDWMNSTLLQPLKKHVALKSKKTAHSHRIIVFLLPRGGGKLVSCLEG